MNYDNQDLISKLHDRGMAKNFVLSGKAKNVFRILHLAAHSADLKEWTKQDYGEMAEDRLN